MKGHFLRYFVSDRFGDPTCRVHPWPELLGLITAKKVRTELSEHCLMATGRSHLVVKKQAFLFLILRRHLTCLGSSNYYTFASLKAPQAGSCCVQVVVTEATARRSPWLLRHLAVGYPVPKVSFREQLLPLSAPNATSPLWQGLSIPGKPLATIPLGVHVVWWVTASSLCLWPGSWGGGVPGS